MAAQVVSLFQRPAPVRDWSQQELAEFYRVENALLQAGMRIETDRGVTDDGEPWFAFCRADDGEVFIHFARIGGQYIIAGPAYEGIAKGWDFAALVRDLISRHPLVSPAGPQRKSNIFMHPAALLIAVVGTAFFKTGEAKADDGHDRESAGSRRLTLTKAIGVAVSGQAAASIPVDAHQTLTLVASAIANLDRVGDKAALTGDQRVLAERLKAEASFDPSWIGDSRQIALPSPAAAAAPEKMAAPLAASPAEVSGWLSLAVVLADLGATGDDGAAPVIAPVIESSFDTPALGAAAPLVSADTPTLAETPSVLVVDLASDALPDVMAIRLLRIVDAKLGLQTKVIVLDELPAFLNGFVEQAQHVDAVNTADVAVVAPPPAEVAPPAPQAEADLPALDASPLVPDVAPPSDDGPSLPPVDESPAPLVRPADPLPAPSPLNAQATIAAILAAIEHFDRATAGHQVVWANNDIIVYDTRIETGLLSRDEIQTVKHVFDDGTTLTLIGRDDAVNDFWAAG